MSNDTEPINDGGPAFPGSIAVDPSGDVYASHDIGVGGMTIRDYFAAKAMGGLIAQFKPNQRFVYKGVANISYRIADAMIAAREDVTS